MRSFARTVTLLAALIGMSTNAHSFDVCGDNSAYRIFVGNGVRTTVADLITSTKVASKLVGGTHRGRTIFWAGAYNRSTYLGLGDLLEAIQQEIDDSNGSYGWADFMAGVVPTATSYVAPLLAMVGHQAYLEAGASLETDTARHVARYKGWIDRGDMVLTVAHSQGNWFALDAYDRLSGNTAREDDDGYGVFHVASPTTRVAGRAVGDVPEPTGEWYLTNNVDFINLIPSNLPSNFNFLLHDFNAVNAHFLDNYSSSIFPDSSSGIGLKDTAT